MTPNTIQEIKNKIGQSARDIIGNGMVKKGKKYQCPNNAFHKNGDRDPSMSWHEEALHFHCFACGHKIDIYDYYKEQGMTHADICKEVLNVEVKIDEFEKELQYLKPLSEKSVGYMKLRGLTEENIHTFSVMEYKGKIAFLYKQGNRIKGVKLREPIKNPSGAKMTSITGSKFGFYNAEHIADTEKELIICEGEFDCMIIKQAGFNNVVSVGAGSKSAKQMVKENKEFLDRFNNIIIYSDNDEAGTQMDKDFTELLGHKVKVIDKRICKQKDANLEYFKYGCDQIRQVIESARFKIEGRRDLDKDPYKGLKPDAGKFIPTGITDLDNAINDLAPGLLTLITGRSNGGKTTFVKQIIANAIDKKSKVYLMNGENDPEYFLNEFYSVVIGREEKNYNVVKINKRYRKEPKPDILARLQEWHKGKFYMFNKGESKLKTTEALIAMVDEELRYNQHDLIIIDNLMSILSTTAFEKYEQQADFVQRLKDLALAYKTHIILVLHPNKTYQKGQKMDFEHISGSSDIYNKADNIIAVIREFDFEKKEQGIDGQIAVIKNRYYGDLIEVDTSYSKETGLLLQISDDGLIVQYNFNWEGKEKWIEEKLPF